MSVPKLLFSTILLLFVSYFAHGQYHVRLRINLYGIDTEKLALNFDDGMVLNDIDLGHIDSIVVVDKPAYTSYPRISVTYDRKYHKSYFIGSDSATLNLFYDASKKNDPLYINGNINTRAIYDTASNEIYYKLRREQTAELLKLNDLFTKKDLATNDSSKYELKKLIKTINAKSMDFLLPYAKDFFSFYYFKNQILTLASFVEPDPEYYRTLLAYYNDAFPKEFRTTGEGKQITSQLHEKISPIVLQNNTIMPDVYLKDTYGDTIFLKNQKEHFVLLDFWASWCLPCVKQIPDLKALRKEFSEDRLKIVSISIDRDSIHFSKSMKEYKMNWTHSFDRGGLLSESLGISSIPTVMLVGQDGKILYYKNGGKLDLGEIRRIVMKE